MAVPARSAATSARWRAGSGGEFSLIVTVNPGIAPGTVISNTVSASSAVADPNSANNSATATATVTAGGSAPIAFRASASAATTGRTLTIARPAGTQVNDVLVAAVYWDNSSPNTITPPGGMTQRALMNQCCPLTLADKQLGNAGPSGQQIAAASGNVAFWTGQSIALRRIP